jgi:hypothetical protein
MQHMDTSKLSNLQDNSPLLIYIHSSSLQDPEYYMATIMRERKAEEITLHVSRKRFGKLK